MSLTEKAVLERSKAKSLNAVRNLNVWGCKLTDISMVANLPNLEVLNLRYSKFETACLLASLSLFFYLSSCNNIKSLKDLKSCKY